MTAAALDAPAPAAETAAGGDHGSGPAPSLAAEIIDLHKHYYLGEITVHALKGVSLEIPRGDFIAIMGTSGSGKSTMLNLLGALDRPTGGSYLLGGDDVATMNDDELSDARNRLIGFIFQSYNLIPQYTVTENIAVPMHYRGEAAGGRDLRPEDHDRIAMLAERVGLGGRLDHRPFQLSGGQQQRVAIARALVNDPEIILADEPTGNLDSTTEEEILELFDELNAGEGRTIVMVTHETQVAERAKRSIYMQDGRIAGEGTFPG